MGKPIIRNWRDVGPRVGHDNAIVWRLLNPAQRARAEPGAVADDPQAGAVLQRLSGVARHALQGRQRSDYHVHRDAEQLYYILRGAGALVVDGERYPVREGDVVYLPAGVQHQAVNETDDWMEHLIITGRLD
jgi:quercetin dioxygenase-like cupin family protein